MNSTEALARFRHDAGDEIAPYLWSDEAIFRYLDEAQVEFCRRTEGLEDGRSPVARVSVAAGDEFAPLDASILKTRSTRLEHGGVSHALQLLSIEEFETRGYRLLDHPGMPRAAVTGLDPRALRLVPAPHEDMTLQMVVMRLPVTRIDGPGVEFEVALMHQPGLLLYALSLAYARPDPDTMDRVKSEAFAVQFADFCTRARREQGRLRNPNGVTRFSW